MTQPTTTDRDATAPGLLLVVGRLLDFPKMGAYSKALPPVYAQYGGAYLAMGGPGRGLDWLDGPHRDRSLVLARFASVEAVQRFWWSPEYRAAAKLRDGAGAFNVVAVPGLAGAAVPSAGGAFLVVLTLTLDAAAADAAQAALASELVTHGGRLLAGAAPGELRLLEGDPAWDRVTVAHLPSAAAVDALLASPRLAEQRASRTRAGVSYVARAAAFAAPA